MIEETDMKFYIVTPTYNSLDWLKRAIRSVADQIGEGVEVHHHVQDGGSKDGTQQWLEEWQRNHQGTSGYIFTYESCPDKGMYDALNHAWDKMPVDAHVTAHLNSDEQYLPDALARVSGAFAGHTDMDMLTATFIVLNSDESYHCHYRPITPTVWRSVNECMIRSSSCFHRASSMRRYGVRFDTAYKIISDRVFFLDILKTNPKVYAMPELITSTDAMTGTNLAWSPNLKKEEEYYRSKNSDFVLLIGWFLTRTVNLCRRIVDCFCSPPREVCIYRGDEEVRSAEMVEKPTCLWRMNKQNN